LAGAKPFFFGRHRAQSDSNDIRTEPAMGTDIRRSEQTDGSSELAALAAQVRSLE
jgi:hypothetical protein